MENIKAMFFSGVVTMFANVPNISEVPAEKLTFGGILFFIIFWYMKKIMPQSQELYAKVCEENRVLHEEIGRLKTELAILTERTAIVTQPKQEWGD